MIKGHFRERKKREQYIKDSTIPKTHIKRSLAAWI